MTNTNKKNKNTRKLLGAVGMLSVSAAMLVSSTFAWFSMNKKVTAQTMSISAKSADPIIEISANGTTFANNLYTSGETVNWQLPSTTNVKLKLVTPTAISGENAVSWGWAASSNHANAEKTNETTAVTLSAKDTPAPTNEGRSAYLGDDKDLYVLKQKLTIRNVSVDVEAKNLTISKVEIDKGSNTIANAVRVLFVSGGKYAVYQPAASGTGMTLAATGEAPWLTGTTPTATAMTKTTATDAQGADLPIVSATLAAKGTGTTPAAGSSVDVDVYMYFDGTDDDAYTDLATNLGEVSTSFEFSID